MSVVLLKLIGLVVPLRATSAEEVEGLDIMAHGEEAYTHVGGSTPIVAEPKPGFAAVQPALRPETADV